MNTFIVVTLNSTTKHLLDSSLWIHASYVPHMNYVCHLGHCWAEGDYYDCVITYLHLVDSELLCYLTLLDCVTVVNDSVVSIVLLRDLRILEDNLQ